MRALLLAFLCAGVPASVHGALEWEQPSLTLDAGPFDEEATGVFVFQNTGDKPVEITDVHSSCGCTVAELEKKTYAPGEKGKLRAVFSFNGREGRQVKTITVTTDDPKSRFHDLTLTVNIPRLFEAEPRFVVWRQGQPPDPKTITVRVLLPDIVELTGVECRDERFTATLAAQEDTPGTHELTITPRRTDETAQATIIVNTNAPGDESRLLTIYALVR